MSATDKNLMEPVLAEQSLCWERLQYSVRAEGGGGGRGLAGGGW